MRNPVLALLILITFTLQMGCGIRQIQKFDEHTLIMQLAVSAATARVLHEKPEWKERTVEIADVAINAIDGGLVTTIDSLKDVVKKEINWASLLPEEKVLVNMLIDAIAQEMKNYLIAQGYSNTEVDEFLIRTKMVMLWVKDTASIP